MRIVIRVFPGGVFKAGPRLPLVKSYCAFMVDCDVALLVPFVVSNRDGLLIVQDGDCVQSLRLISPERTAPPARGNPGIEVVETRWNQPGLRPAAYSEMAGIRPAIQTCFCVSTRRLWWVLSA